ncbi:hypothetical protein [Ferruginibacter sp.]
MTKKIFVLLFFIAVAGCRHTNRHINDDTVAATDTILSAKQIEPVIKPDTTNQDIYNFMEIVINERKLNRSYGLSTEPEAGCNLSGNDKKFLRTLLIEKPKKKPVIDRDDWRTMTITVDAGGLTKCLTESDINYMLSQKQQLAAFRWDNSRLKFNTANNNNWYCFSIPLFSKDRKKAVMMIRDLCPGLCGTGSTLLFIKENGKWTSETGDWWVH